MSKICGSCTYLDLDYGGNCYGKYYCNKKYDRHLATEFQVILKHTRGIVLLLTMQ